MDATYDVQDIVKGNLRSLFVHFLSECSERRANSLDADNVSFHRNNEFVLKLPVAWRGCTLQALLETFLEVKLLNNKTEVPDVLFFYSNTICYRRAYEANKEYDQFIEYCSYYEFQCAILNSVLDIRAQERIRDLISAASAVVVLDASKCQENVLNAIRQFAGGSLFLID